VVIVLSIVKAGETFAYGPTLLMERTSKAIQATVAKPGPLVAPVAAEKWARPADIERKV
jgi:hypothetical protein